MRAETIRRIFLNYATLYREYGTIAYYQLMQHYYQMLLTVIKAELKIAHR